MIEPVDGVIEFEKVENFYKLQGEIGTGAYGKVYRVTNISTRETSALKVLKFDSFVKSQINEVCIPQAYPHDHIIEIKQVKFLEMDKLGKVVAIEMEDRQLDLQTYIFKIKHGLCARHLRLMYNMARSLEHLHTNQHLHSDVKCSNFVLDLNNQDEACPSTLKLIDFGLVQDLTQNRGMCKLAYTTVNRAPEIFFELPYDDRADVWALGCVFFTLLHGYHPFYHPSRREVKNVTQRIFRLCGHPGNYYPPIMSTPLWKTLKFRNQRFVRQPLYPADQKINALLMGMLELDPQRRLRMSDVMFNDVFQHYYKLNHLTSPRINRDLGAYRPWFWQFRNTSVAWMAHFGQNQKLDPRIIFASIEFFDQLLIQSNVPTSTYPRLSGAVILITAFLRNRPLDIRETALEVGCEQEELNASFNQLLVSHNRHFLDKTVCEEAYVSIKPKYKIFTTLMTLCWMYTGKYVDFVTRINLVRPSFQLLARLYYDERGTHALEAYVYTIESILTHIEQLIHTLDEPVNASLKDSISLFCSRLTDEPVTRVLEVCRSKLNRS